MKLGRNWLYAKSISVALPIGQVEQIRTMYVPVTEVPIPNSTGLLTSPWNADYHSRPERNVSTEVPVDDSQDEPVPAGSAITLDPEHEVIFDALRQQIASANGSVLTIIHSLSNQVSRHQSQVEDYFYYLLYAIIIGSVSTILVCFSRKILRNTGQAAMTIGACCSKAATPRSRVEPTYNPVPQNPDGILSQVLDEVRQTQMEERRFAEALRRPLLVRLANLEQALAQEPCQHARAAQTLGATYATVGPKPGRHVTLFEGQELTDREDPTPSTEDEPKLDNENSKNASKASSEDGHSPN